MSIDTKSQPLKDRIEKALADFTSNRASMHVPPLDTDVDVVLAECSSALESAEKRIAELTAPDGNAIAWESTTPVYIKFITDERYRRLRPGYQKWYKPYRCSNCAAGISVKGE